MKTKITLSIILLSFCLNLSAQDCSTGRYFSEVFSSVTVISDIPFGSNIDLNGATVNLDLDVYTPDGDVLAERPLIIWTHGGSFLFGDKGGTDVVPLCEDFAKRGYVSASINYRLGMENLFTGPDSVDATETVIRAVHDARAAVRFFKKDYADNGNTYGIDTSNIFFAGVSAGAIIAVHLGYLDKVSEMPAYVDTTQPGLGGGIEGTSGNSGYVSNVRAIISSSGALRDTSWMEVDDTPIISFHGDQDGTVPFGTDFIYVQGIFKIMLIDGSESIHKRATSLGMNHCFEPWPGQDHVPHVNNADYYDTLLTMTTNFLLQFVCGAAPTCDYTVDTTVTVAEPISMNWGMEVYPNPATESVVISWNKKKVQNATVQLYDVYGRKVRIDGVVNENELIIKRADLPNGIYFVRLIGEEGSYTAKLIFE